MVKDLLKTLRILTSNYLPQKDWQLIEHAYKYAQRAHEGAKRESGEPYIAHPLRVAQILAEMALDAETIAAGLLHDVIEDSNATEAELKQEFGADVAQLVAGVTKLARIRLKGLHSLLPRFVARRREEQFRNKRQIESLRKMLVAMASDIRVILIKLADRLHNMETLDAIRPDKRARIAQETLEIYAPLAYRLGMGDIKGQLEDLAFPYVNPAEFRELQTLVASQINEREAYVKRFRRILNTYLETEGVKVIDVHGRVKHLYSLWRKLQRYNNNISKIYDLVAIRIIVPTTTDCYHALGLIHSRWNPLLGRIKDYIATPKPNGYQSLHTTVFGVDGEITEIQIRTERMHERAEYGIAAHWHYDDHKHAKTHAQEESTAKIEWLKELKKWQASLKDPRELKEALRLDLFSDQIFVYTPHGDIINLPSGATPIDFAYAIHSDVGNSCTGAKVNKKLVPLQTPLTNGDIIEIVTAKQQARPKRDWLNFVKTQKARQHIKAKLKSR